MNWRIRLQIFNSQVKGPLIYQIFLPIVYCRASNSINADNYDCVLWQSATSSRCQSYLSSLERETWLSVYIYVVSEELAVL